MVRRTCMEGFFGQFLRESTVHGVKYIGARDRHPWEKLFWTIAVLGSLGFSFYLVEEVYKKYNDNPVIISFQPLETHIAQIPFPAITLCNVNILKTNWVLEVYNFANRELTAHMLSNYTNPGKVVEAVILSEHMTHYCLAAPSMRRILNQTLHDVLGYPDLVSRIQNFIVTSRQDANANYEDLLENGLENISDEIKFNVSRFSKMASHNCEDMLLKCMWAREAIPCEELFNTISTQHGSCCVFNMMPKYILRNIPENDTRAISEMELLQEEEKEAWQAFDADDLKIENEQASKTKFPKHQKAGGKPYGLSILINPELDVYSTCNTNDAFGFKMVAHSPISFPGIMDYGVAIPPSSEVFIDVEPQLTTAIEQKLQSIPVNKRSCYFPSDEQSKLNSYKFYSSSNCLDECLARLTLQYCKCVRYFMPRNSSTQLCGAKKLKCSEEVRKRLMETGKKGECSECKPSCTEITYKLQVSHFPLRNIGESAEVYYNTSEETNKLAVNYSIVHIYLGSDSLYAKERTKLYDAADLIANAGGLLSLTLGFSIISLVEVFYFFTLRAWFQRKEDDAAEKDEEENDYSNSRSGRSNGASMSNVVKPRIMDGLHNNNSTKMTGFYGWAMAANRNGTNVVKVQSSQSKDGQGWFTNRKTGRKRIPTFELLNGQPLYPYLS